MSLGLQFNGDFKDEPIYTTQPHHSGLEHHVCVRDPSGEQKYIIATVLDQRLAAELVDILDMQVYFYQQLLEQVKNAQRTQSEPRERQRRMRS